MPSENTFDPNKHAAKLVSVPVVNTSATPHKTAFMAQTGVLRIMGCGGAGVNAAYQFNQASDEPNCARILPGYIDASRSNLHPDMRTEDIYVLPNVDGSGKIRKENHKEISNVIKQILLQIEPGDFNVVVFSASGG
jgi:hypothetical protein